MKKIARRAGLVDWERFVPHSLRMTACSLEVSSGQNTRDAAARSGHRSMKSFQKYVPIPDESPESKIPEFELPE
jgi:integrase/recombinase XerD